nr:MAG: hypothetical protein 3 [Leviviridae sp.]
MKRKYITDCMVDPDMWSAHELPMDTHWALLQAYVRASAGVLGFERFCDVYSCVLSRSVPEYLTRGKAFLNQFSMYGKEQSVAWVRTNRQAWSLLRKYPFSDAEHSVDKKAVAVEKIRLAEAACLDTNARLASRYSDQYPPFVYRARQIIDEVLGDCNHAIREIVLHGKSHHGRGSTLSNKGARVTAYYKYADFPYTCTKRASKYALAAISSDPDWINILENSGLRKEVPLDVWPHGPRSRAQSETDLFRDCVELAESDRIAFVPKDATTDRGIAFGASLNLFLQLGVNSYLTSRLRRFGVDLRDQSRNQRFAHLGSQYCERDGKPSPDQYSTIDLESASDTVSIGAVKLLLPPDWFTFLSDLRHESGEVDGELIFYNKFSAMGNGYTFPLESLIFWATCKAVQEIESGVSRPDDIAVYGDDIIVRRKFADTTIDALNFLGFCVNRAKTFIEGPFKESCGCDYYKGKSVRPIHLKRVSNKESTVYYLANRIARVVMAGGPDSGLQAVYNECVRRVEPRRRRFGPTAHTSDNCFVVPLGSLRQSGVRPWLSVEEVKFVNRQLSIQNTWQSDPRLPVTLLVEENARTYRGRGNIQLYLWKISHQGDSGGDAYCRADLVGSVEQLLHQSAGQIGQITRRGNLARKWKVAVVPFWDYLDNASYNLRHHPAWYMDTPF